MTEDQREAQAMVDYKKWSSWEIKRHMAVMNSELQRREAAARRKRLNSTQPQEGGS